MRQRQIHVVAAEHQVLAHGGAREGRQRVRTRLFHADQREVGGATAYVDHEHQASVLQLRVELLALQNQPVVEGGLGFFQQVDLRQTGQLRGLQRQRTRALVKRRRNREHHDLLCQRSVGMCGVPRGLHVCEVAGRSLYRRNLVYVFRRAPGQDGGGAIHAIVREPALGAGHQTRWNGGTEIARPAANRRGALAAGT